MYGRLWGSRRRGSMSIRLPVGIRAKWTLLETFDLHGWKRLLVNGPWRYLSWGCQVQDRISSSFLNRFSKSHFWVIPYHFPIISGFMQKPEIQTGNALKIRFSSNTPARGWQNRVLVPTVFIYFCEMSDARAIMRALILFNLACYTWMLILIIFSVKSVCIRHLMFQIIIGVWRYCRNYKLIGL